LRRLWNPCFHFHVSVRLKQQPLGWGIKSFGFRF
jgi:hypothetical protein